MTTGFDVSSDPPWPTSQSGKKNKDQENDREKERAFVLDNDLLDARTVLVSGMIDDKLAAGVIARLLVLENRDPDAPINIYINSPGGSADSGFAMYDVLRFVSCPVRTVVTGLCASAAVLVFLGAEKGSRMSLPGSRFLLHQPSTIGQGTASDLRITAEQIVKLRERFNHVVSEAAGRKPEEILEAADRDFWLSADEAAKYGLVDKIITSRSEF